MSREILQQALTRLVGARVIEISFGVSALSILLLKTEADRTILFRLKTANFVHPTVHPPADYAESTRQSLSTLYGLIERNVVAIDVSPSHATVTFDQGAQLHIMDTEGLWDNLFSLELDEGKGRVEFSYDKEFPAAE